MSKWVSRIYGILIILVALDAMIFGILPQALLPFIVILLGILIFFTPIGGPNNPQMPGYGQNYSPYSRESIVAKIRRRVFGVYMVLAGILSFTGLLNFPFGAYASVYIFSGQLIILLIGVISLLTSFGKTRNMQISSI